MATVVLYVRVPTELKRELEDLASQTDTTLSAVTVAVLRHGLGTARPILDDFVEG